MSDIREEGSWRWVDGQLVDMDMFVTTMNNHDSSYSFGDSRRTNADCGRIANEIHDINCEKKSFFICGING